MSTTALENTLRTLARKSSALTAGVIAELPNVPSYAFCMILM
jgi:hypothetical protein